MQINFRKFHIIAILKDFLNNNLPLDVFLKKYFKNHKSLGSKDRKEIYEKLYKFIKWKSLFEFLYPKLSLENKIDKLDNFNFEDYLDDSSIPLHIRLGFPKDYFNKIKKCFNEKKTISFCLASNSLAPTTIRSNPLKISRDDLFDLLKQKYPVQKCKKSPLGIIFQKRINFFDCLEFKKGFFEAQDEASQLVGQLINPKPKDHVLDYCCGSGGKTLGFAYKMQNKGQIYIHDIRDFILLEAKKRFQRAGIENYQIVTSHKLKNLKQKMDLIILDVPCSGSGTLKRNPDMKWNFSINNLSSLIMKQREIFDKAVTFLKEKGKIVYITCSIFPDENEKQINFFTQKYNLKIEKNFFTFPEKNSHDGFFGCVLNK